LLSGLQAKSLSAANNGMRELAEPMRRGGRVKSEPLGERKW
jgi:hypothetical protein